MTSVRDEPNASSAPPPRARLASRCTRLIRGTIALVLALCFVAVALDGSRGVPTILPPYKSPLHLALGIYFFAENGNISLFSGDVYSASGFRGWEFAGLYAHTSDTSNVHWWQVGANVGWAWIIGAIAASLFARELYLLRRTAGCVQCGYPVCPSDKCPECGRAYRGSRGTT